MSQDLQELAQKIWLQHIELVFSRLTRLKKSLKTVIEDCFSSISHDMDLLIHNNCDDADQLKNRLYETYSCFESLKELTIIYELISIDKKTWINQRIEILKLEQNL